LAVSQPGPDGAQRHGRGRPGALVARGLKAGARPGGRPSRPARAPLPPNPQKGYCTNRRAMLYWVMPAGAGKKAGGRAKVPPLQKGRACDKVMKVPPRELATSDRDGRPNEPGCRGVRTGWSLKTEQRSD